MDQEQLYVTSGCLQPNGDLDLALNTGETIHIDHKDLINAYTGENQPLITYEKVENGVAVKVNGITEVVVPLPIQ